MPALPYVTTEEVIGRKPCWKADDVRQAAQALPERATVIERVKAFRDVLTVQELLWLVCSDKMMPLECGIRWAERCDRALGAKNQYLRAYGIIEADKRTDRRFHQVMGCVLKMYDHGLLGRVWDILLEVLVEHERR